MTGARFFFNFFSLFFLHLKKMEKESLRLSSCQQWKVAFIHAFASTFNPQQTIAPSFFKLPEFTPNVTL
jgi:hypothetical protein